MAREAVSRYYGDLKIDPTDQVLMTPGTSIAYWYCFKLLAEPGDEILSPQPSISAVRLHCENYAASG